jgi:hypothetical protein
MGLMGTAKLHAHVSIRAPVKGAIPVMQVLCGLGVREVFSRTLGPTDLRHREV